MEEADLKVVPTSASGLAGGTTRHLCALRPAYQCSHPTAPSTRPTAARNTAWSGAEARHPRPVRRVCAGVFVRRLRQDGDFRERGLAGGLLCVRLCARAGLRLVSWWSLAPALRSKSAAAGPGSWEPAAGLPVADLRRSGLGPPPLLVAGQARRRYRARRPGRRAPERVSFGLPQGGLAERHALLPSAGRTAHLPLVPRDGC